VGWSCSESQLGSDRDRPKAFGPITERIFQSAIQHMNANVEEALDDVPVPSHLLLLHDSLGDNLVDGRLDKPGCDPLSRTVTAPSRDK